VVDERDDAEYEEPQGDETELGSLDEPEGAKLFAGKFKTAEEMERAYQELQSMTGKQGRAIGQIRQHGYDIDDEGNVIAPQQYAPEPVPQPQTETDDPNSEWWENPQQAAQKVIRQAQQQAKVANSNKRFQINKWRGHPMFNTVAADFEAELDAIDDGMMADPRAATYYGDLLFKKAVGEKALQMAQNREDPNTRTRILRELGLESPQQTPDTGGVEVDDRARRALSEFGLDNAGRKGVIDRFAKKGDV